MFKKNLKTFVIYARVNTPVDEESTYTDVWRPSHDLIKVLKEYFADRSCTAFYKVSLASDPAVVKVSYAPIHCNFDELGRCINLILLDHDAMPFNTFDEASKGEVEAEGEDLKEETDSEDSGQTEDDDSNSR